MRTSVFAVLTAFGLAASAVSQTPGQTDNSRSQSRSQPGPRRPNQSQAAAGTTSQTPHDASGAARGADQSIAVALLLGNQEEVELAEFARQRSRNPQVKEFAAMMIKDHQPAVDKLTQLAGAGGTTGRTAQQTGSAPAGSSPSSNRARADETAGALGGSQGATDSDATPRTAMAGTSGADQFHRQAAQRCLALTKEELGQLEGAEFDKAYIGQQMVAHLQMLAKLEAAQEMSSGQLREFAAQSIQTVKHHQEMAKQIKEQLKSNPDSAAARTTATEPVTR